MKPILLLSSLATALFLSGCGEKEESATQSSVNAPPSATANTPAAADPNASVPPAQNPDVSAGGTSTKANELGPQ